MDTSNNSGKVVFASTDLRLEDLEKNSGIENKKWLFEKRLDYGKSFFFHHAKQRMDMFNFFLIFVGFVLNGYAALFNYKHLTTASFLALAGALLTLMFMALERRNEELVHISEDVLEALESDVLFYDYKRPVWIFRRRGFWKFKEKHTADWNLGIFRRQTFEQSGKLRTSSGEMIETCTRVGMEHRNSPYEHGIWLPWFQLVIFLTFIALGVAPWIVRFWPNIHQFILDHSCFA